MLIPSHRLVIWVVLRLVKEYRLTVNNTKNLVYKAVDYKISVTYKFYEVFYLTHSNIKIHGNKYLIFQKIGENDIQVFLIKTRRVSTFWIFINYFILLFCFNLFHNVPSRSKQIISLILS